MKSNTYKKLVKLSEKYKDTYPGMEISFEFLRLMPYVTKINTLDENFEEGFFEVDIDLSFGNSGFKSNRNFKFYTNGDCCFMIRTNNSSKPNFKVTSNLKMMEDNNLFVTDKKEEYFHEDMNCTKEFTKLRDKMWLLKYTANNLDGSVITQKFLKIAKNKEEYYEESDETGIEYNVDETNEGFLSVTLSKEEYEESIEKLENSKKGGQK